MKANNKTIYVAILTILSTCLLLGYVPGMERFSAWVTPPVALFLGLTFALLCGQAYPKFNKKVSKKLLQYSVVGLGFGMNLHASLASGKGQGRDDVYHHFRNRYHDYRYVHRAEIAEGES